jgi:Icc-related predicted phosphoesterase
LAALFRRSKREPWLRLFVASDLHGSTRCFRKLLRAPEFYEADILLVAGDLTGKMVIPIVDEGSEFVSTFLGREYRLDPEEVRAHEEVIEDAGFYAYRTTPDELEELEGSRARVDEIFHELVLKRMQSWLELGEARLAELDRECFVVAGNDDYPEVDDILRQGVRIRLVDGVRAELGGGHEVVGLGVSNVTPWHAPRDVPEEEIASRLAATVAEVEDMTAAVYLIHVPPEGSLLDLAPELDADLRPTGAGTNFIHIGSTAVRNFLATYQPLLSLHGHVHESRAIDQLGRTTCINPGSEYAEGILRGAVVNIAHDRVAGHLFVSG